MPSSKIKYNTNLDAELLGEQLHKVKENKMNALTPVKNFKVGNNYANLFIQNNNELQ